MCGMHRKGVFEMRKNLGAKPYLFPQPVMIIGTYDADGTPNVMNAAWSSGNEIK